MHCHWNRNQREVHRKAFQKLYDFIDTKKFSYSINKVIIECLSSVVSIIIVKYRTLLLIYNKREENMFFQPTRNQVGTIDSQPHDSETYFSYNANALSKKLMPK